MIVHHAAVWSQSFLFMLCIKDRCVNVVLLFLCREMLYTGWHVRCIQPAGRGPLPQWAKGWWRETVSRWPGFFAPRNSGESLSALRDLTVQFKKNVATDKAVKTSVCRINYEVVTYLVLDDWWWRKDSDSMSSLQITQKVKDFSVLSVEKCDHKRWMFTNWNPLKSVLQHFQLSFNGSLSSIVLCLNMYTSTCSVPSSVWSSSSPRWGSGPTCPSSRRTSGSEWSAWNATLRSPRWFSASLNPSSWTCFRIRREPTRHGNHAAGSTGNTHGAAGLTLG